MISSFFSYSIAAFVAAFSGGLVPLYLDTSQFKWLKVAVSFGAGMLLGTALIHMIPEAAELIPHSFGIWTLAGFVLLLTLEKFVMIHSCEEHGCNYHTIGVAAFFGLAVHSVVEGFALASGAATLHVGPLVLAAVLVHKFPAALTLTSLLLLGKKTRGQILGFVVGISLATPLGIALAASLIRQEAWQELTGILLALSSGTFLYIAACDLIPEMHRTEGDRWVRLGSFVLALLLCLAMSHGGGH